MTTAESAGSRRPVVIHYHLFKNAGTSLDTTLGENFGTDWAELDADATGTLKPDRVADYLLLHPEIKALSSHTAELPPPEVPGVKILPLVVLRHPIDRARSIYVFEHKWTDTPSARAARAMSLPDYIDWRLERAQLDGDPTIANYQAYCLARGGEGADLLARARHMAGRLAWIGLVEEFDQSIDRLRKLLEPYFPALRLRAYRANVNSRERSLARRLARMRDELGGRRYARLEEFNRDDLELWSERASGAVRRQIDRD